MTRHWFATAISLVLGCFTAATVVAQYGAAPPTIDAQNSLRPGWSRDGIDPATSRARYTVSPAPTQLAQATSNNGRSFFPNWFGRRSDQPAKQSKSSPPRQANDSNAQSANKGNANAIPPDPATMQDEELPGLGGSPLPQQNSQTMPMTPNKANRPTTPGPPPRVAMQTRPQPPRLTPNTNGTAATPTTRHSPGRRTAPHITPEELRRELSGTFPAPAKTDDATPRVAQADEQIPETTKQNTDTESLATDPTGSDDSETVISDDPVTLPTESAVVEQNAIPAAKPQLLPQPAAQPVNPSPEPPTQRPADVFATPQKSKSAYGKNSPVRMPFSGAATPAAQVNRGKEAFGDALQVAGGGDPNVLASNQIPVLNIDIRGPKQIQVGREAVYRVRLENQSDFPAEGVIATVRIPTGAEVMSTTATQGIVTPAQDGSAKGQLQWQVARLERRGKETLEIHLVPRESRPLELGVSYTLAPIGSRAVVEVQEAKLQLEIAGPNEVLFDRPQVFKLTLSNPGTGPAENVKIDLMPPGGGQDAVSSHPLGNLAPGATQSLEVELTARDAGKLFVKAVASAEGDLTSEAAKEIFCRKPELEVDWRGPATKYAGTMATYYIRARNPGTAPAEDVTVRATLPDGAEFTSASEGQSYDAPTREVTWKIGTLSPGDDNYMELKCVLKSPGANRMKIDAGASKGALADSKVAETNVVAVADLKLDVTDPSGPVAVGNQAVYEIHVVNRGASAAKDVHVVALFSEGIEPDQAEGGMYTVADGRVTFRTIEELQPGRDIVLRIRAHALQPGTHVFRTEVLCRDLEIKLAAEETTRFYADDVPADADNPQNQADTRGAAFQSDVK